MNPNDVLAQQQAYLNQAMHNAQQAQWLYLIVAAVAMLVHFGLVYLFYARLRDIAEELLKLRIAFELAEDRKMRRSGTPTLPPSLASSENPFAGDDPYRPKRH